MALSGLHISFHRLVRDKRPDASEHLQVYGELLGSETIADGGTMTGVGPAEVSVARLIASVDMWVTIGDAQNGPASPIASATTTRMLVQGGMAAVDTIVQPGAKLRAAAA